MTKVNNQISDQLTNLTSSYNKDLVKLALNFFDTVIGEGYLDAEEQATKFNGENNAYYNLNALTRFGFQAKFSAGSVDYANERLNKAEKAMDDEQVRDPENYQSSKQALDFSKAMVQWENALKLSTWDALLYTIAMKEPFTIANFDNRWKLYQDAKGMNTTTNVVVDVDAIKERRKKVA
ncbi:hypothetical protein [uncultured phage MedDCM-OCT-S05-C113]|nr:hypothetical protein [uncultured phage MedDCM-OCT-S05-C113]